MIRVANELAADTQAVRSSANYTRFIILCYARTGSNLLASALNTSPEIICFRELFNVLMDEIGYRVSGYDDKNAEDRALRDSDFRAFLRQRIFCEREPAVRAVGFKLPYHHLWGFPGLLEHLAADQSIYVLHLSRRNLLRVLVSERIALATGGWSEDRKQLLRSKFRMSNVPGALRHPARSVSRLVRYYRPREPEWKDKRRPLSLSPEECATFFEEQQCDAARYLGHFSGHPVLTLYYEDLVAGQNRSLNEVQRFLGVRPHRLAPTTRKQNPEPLRELIANYDDLYDAFHGTPEAGYFD